MAGVTTGAVPSPLGSPQNLLIAASPEILERRSRPSSSYLGPPTLVGLGAVLVLLRLAYPGLVGAPPSAGPPHRRRTSGAPRRDLPVLLSLAVLGALVLAGIVTGLAGGLPPLPPFAVALAAAAPLLLLGPDRRGLVAGVDWRTLLLFVGLFVMTAGVRDSGLVEASFGAAAGSTAVLMAAAVVGSQVVSNVPLVAIALPFVEPHGTTALMALAAGSTIAGHLTLLGAASNLIVVESAGRMGATVRTRAFTGIGLVLVARPGALLLGVAHARRVKNEVRTIGDPTESQKSLWSDRRGTPEVASTTSRISSPSLTCSLCEQSRAEIRPMGIPLAPLEPAVGRPSEAPCRAPMVSTRR